MEGWYWWQSSARSKGQPLWAAHNSRLKAHFPLSERVARYQKLIISKLRFRNIFTVDQGPAGAAKTRVDKQNIVSTEKVGSQCSGFVGSLVS